MNFRLPLATALIAATLAHVPIAAQTTGPSTSTAPYLLPAQPEVTISSILTTGDSVNGYRMGGIPDGLGAYDNDDGTFTVLMNHEIFANASGPVGAVRAHGAKGAYVSEWVIRKRDLKVLSGADLMRKAYQRNAAGAWEELPATGTLGKTSAFARFCSADLAPRSAFYDKRSRKGTRERIFLNGEESAPTYQRGVAHVATGPDKGSSYVLPWAASANASWENLLAHPNSGAKTIVVANSDGGGAVSTGVYVYVGDKRDVGNDVERAGLVDGTLYRVAVIGGAVENRNADAGLGLALNARGHYDGPFSLVPGPDAASANSTNFLRPEDGTWDTRNPSRYYFVTTDRMDAAKDGNANPDIPAGQVGRSRLWQLTFTDIQRPELGGRIEMLLDGTTANGTYQMLDNITVNRDGTLVLLEDVGNNVHNGKVWHYDPDTGALTQLAKFDPALFGDIGVTAPITKDEETSGVIDITRILDREDGRVYNLLVAQNHAASADPELVEGGQLLLMSYPKTKRREDDRGRGRDGDRD